MFVLDFNSDKMPLLKWIGMNSECFAALTCLLFGNAEEWWCIDSFLDTNVYGDVKYYETLLSYLW